MQHRDDGIYTLSERTEKKYNVGQALASAKRRLQGHKRWNGSVNITTIAGRNLKDAITLEELNDIAERIERDSLYG